MPLEGHWQRVNTPLRTLTHRERRVVYAAVVLITAALIAVVLLVASASSAPPRPGCIDAIVPGAMGGQPIDACGAGARRICRQRLGLSDPGSLAVEADCRRAKLR
jgi:hypothetical protein